MTGLGEDVYTDRSTALDALTEESQRLGMYGDAPDGIAELIEVAGIALYDRLWNRTSDGGLYELELIDSKRHALAVLESLGIPLSVLAAIRAGEWMAVPRVATNEMLAAVRQYDYAGMIVHDPDQDDWAAHLAAAPKTPEETR